MSKGDIVRDQLADGNRGAQGYFTKRVDMMLQSETDADRLHKFMRNWWPSFKAGLAHGQEGADRAETSRNVERLNAMIIRSRT